MKLIAPQWIAPVEPAATVLHDHAVAIEGERIVAVLPAQQAREAWPDAAVTELPGHLLVPGFVNLHTHVPMTLLRGAGDDLPLERWLRERIWPLEAALISPEFVADGAVLACAEMLLGGVTCFSDMYFYPEEVARAALDMVLMARVLMEQEAMREAAHELGDDHPADLTACRMLYWAAEEALEGFDRRLEAGLPLAEALAVEVLVESVPSSVER